MADAFVDSQSLDIGCPGPASVGDFVATIGKASYRLVNDTDDDVFFNILVQLTDSAGNSREYSQTLQIVSAKGNLVDSHTLVINANYTTPGRVTATLTVNIT